MDKPLSQLVFYDGNCGLCDRVVQFLLKVDKHQIFMFAPLQGKTAAHYLQHLPPKFKTVDSLVLVENFQTGHPQVHVLAKGALRIAWLLGGLWKLIGWLSFLPSFLFNWAYRLVARNRHHLFPQTLCILPPPGQEKRFLR